MQLELRRVAPLRAANVLALLYAISMLVFAIPAFAIFSLMPEATTSDPEQSKQAFTAFRWFILVAYPMFGLVFGWFGGLVGASLYNAIAPRIGGLLFEYLPSQQPPGAPAA
jgi:hypothetical protein